MKEQRVKISSYAGLLLSGANGERRQPGTRKSLVLLGGRLLMALLFVFVGVTQAGRGPAGAGWRADRAGGSGLKEGCMQSVAAAVTPPEPGRRLSAVVTWTVAGQC